MIFIKQCKCTFDVNSVAITIISTQLAVQHPCPSLLLACMTIPKNFSGILFFSADWAGDACAAVRQFLNTQRTVQSFELVEVVESEENDATFEAFGIEAVPAVLYLTDGKEQARVVGFNLKELNTLLQGKSTLTSSSNGTTPSTTTAPSSALSNEDLKQLISQAPLMLFIKGTPEHPQCGFTGQLLRLLASHGLQPHRHFVAFNILADERVRQGLKEFSQWPTYPQIYWKGELLGGLDILKEMFVSGQMDSIVSELLK